MQIDPWILAFSAVTVIATIGMGFWSAKRSKTAGDFFVAGRSVSVGWNASAISGEYLSAASFMGVAGMVMSSGYDALWYPVCYACGYLFLLLFIAGPLRRFGAYTIPDFAEGRFDSPVFRKIAVVFVLFIGFFYTMPQMKGAGTTLAYIFPGLPYWVGVVLVGAVITLNVAMGGMKGITLVQAFQYWIKMFAISVPVFVLMLVYGHYGKQVGINGTQDAPTPSGKRFDAEEKLISGAGLAVQGMPRRLAKEMEAGLEKTSTSPGEQYRLVIIRMSLEEISNTNFVCDFGDALNLLAKHETREIWSALRPNAPPPQLYFNPMTRSVTPACERFREGFAAAGFGFLESSNAIVVVPSEEFGTLKDIFDRYGLAGLQCHHLLVTDSGVIGWIDSSRWSQPNIGWIQQAKIAISRLRHPQPNPAASWAVWSAEIFSKLARITGERLLVAQELVALENADRDYGVWIQFPGSISDREWAKVATDALRTNGIVATDGYTPVKTNLCAMVEGASGTRFIVPKARTALYARPDLFGLMLRRPLPDRAPKDETWLNPFGPLTTKAAKAANAVPRWNLSSDLRSRLVDYRNRPAPNLWESMARSLEGTVDRIGSSKSAPSPASQFGTFTNMATNATQSIRGGFPVLSALRELGLLLGRPVLVATDLPRPKPVISGSFQTRDQFVNYLIALFLTNGVRLDLSGDAIKAVSVADWERYQKNPLSVSFVPNQTFAMRVGPYDERQPDGSVIVRHVEPRTLLANYGDVLGKRALMAMNLPTNGVDFNPTFEVMLAHEAKAAMERTFLGRGITIIPAGHKEVWAVPTADLARYQLPPVNARALSLLYTYSLIIALVCGTAGLPHILVRFYTNPDGVAAKRTTMWVMILIGVFYLFPPVIGVMGRNLLPNLYVGVGAKGTDKVVLELPRVLNEEKVGKWESGKMRDDTNGAALSPAHSPTDPPAASLEPQRKKFPWGSILSGVTCAGAFAAFMSTFSGLLVSMTGALAHDVYGRMLRPQATPEQRMRMFKWCAVIVGGLAVLLGMQVEPLQINFMVGQAFAIAAASYFPLLFVSVWWRKLTMKGAATGMLTGGTLALAGISLTSFTDLKWLPLDAFWAAHPLLRILCEQPAIWAVPLAIGLMVMVSKLTSHEVPADIRMKMLVLHAPEKLGLKQEYIQEQQPRH